MKFVVKQRVVWEWCGMKCPGVVQSTGVTSRNKPYAVVKLDTWPSTIAQNCAFPGCVVAFDDQCTPETSR